MYQQKCARCHGEAGQGVPDQYDGPLQGDLSIDELAELVDATMPQDAPEECVGDEAGDVATYIFDEFYSPAAQREKGQVAIPRVELLRLTAPQYRNVVADLIGFFTPPQRGESDSTPTGGLRGEYFESDGMNKASRFCFQRVDHYLDFDFGKWGPVPQMAADQFTIIWNGSLAAPHTGDYEFRIRTPNGARLYLNFDARPRDGALRDDSARDRHTAFIDAWVSSGEMREETGRVFLLSGRRYPVRLEFFKYLDAAASLTLEWKPPHGVWSVLDGNYLSPQRAPRTWVVDTPLPADDRSLGYERGSSVSREWHAATTSAAVATADEVVDRLRHLARVRDGAKNREAKLGEFLARLASVAFRRPLTADEDRLFREDVFADAPNTDTAVRRAVLIALTSPHFLYTNLMPAGESPSQHAIAARLSFAIWDSIPDESLLEAAEKGELATPEQIAGQARRMLGDPRAREKMRGFFRHWLEFDERDLAKDESLFPEFDEAVIADLRRSLELFVDQVVWSEASDYRELLLADYLLVNERLRALYQDEFVECAETDPAGGSDGEFTVARCAPDRRSGILTHPYLLSALAYHNNTSPIHRGVFLTRNIVGRGLKPPPVAQTFEESRFTPELTMREKITELTQEKACMSCHSVINPLGFALENFDAVGRWRTVENEKPIDPRSDYTTAGGTTVELAGARDIATFAVTSDAAHRAFVTQLFRHLVQQNPAAYGPDMVERLRNEFANDGFNVQNLMVRIASLAAAYDPTAVPEPEPLP